MKKIIIIAALFIAGGAYYLYSSTEKNEAAVAAEPAAGAPQGPGVSIATVIEKDITEWSEFSGRLEAIEKVEVRPRVNGAIEKVHFQDGAFVKKGDLLFTIDPKPYAAEVERAKGALASAESTLINARMNFERAKKLLETRTISRRDYDDRVNSLSVAEGNLQSAKGVYESAKLNLEYTQIVAPVSGKVSRAEITAGNVINAGAGAPVLTTIVSIDPLYASFEVDEQTFLTYISGVSNEELKNVPVKMGLSNQSQTEIKGAIHSFDNQLNVSSGTIRVRAVFDNKDGKLVPGLFARIRLGSPEKHTAILINERAIGTDQSKKFVYVLEDGKATYREVVIGPSHNGLKIVRSGLKSGEKIIVNGLMKVRPGTPVTAEEVDMVTLQVSTAQAAPTPAAQVPAEEAPVASEEKPAEESAPLEAVEPVKLPELDEKKE